METETKANLSIALCAFGPLLLLAMVLEALPIKNWGGMFAAHVCLLVLSSMIVFGACEVRTRVPDFVLGLHGFSAFIVFYFMVEWV
ncbi:MAG: hypothetical protein AAF468_12500 [Pseudomonadota bacterium]